MMIELKKLGTSENLSVTETLRFLKEIEKGNRQTPH